MSVCLQYGELVCERCSPGCITCDDVTPCSDVIVTRVVLLGVQVFTLAVSVAVGIAVVRLRKTKATIYRSLDFVITSDHLSMRYS